MDYIAQLFEHPEPVGTEEYIERAVKILDLLDNDKIEKDRAKNVLSRHLTKQDMEVVEKRLYSTIVMERVDHLSQELKEKPLGAEPFKL